MSAVDRSMIHAPGLYLSNITCFSALLYMTNSNNIKALCIPHGKERTNVLRKDEKKRPYKYKKEQCSILF